MANTRVAVPAAPARARGRTKAARTGYLSAIGVRDESPRGIKKAIEAGLPYAAALALQDSFALSFEQLAAMLHLSSRTLERRRTGGSLDPASSDRAVRLARLYSLVLELFEGDAEASRAWLKARNPGLDSLSPEDLMASETGALLVEALLGRLENGVFS